MHTPGSTIPFPSGFQAEDLPTSEQVDQLRILVQTQLPTDVSAARDELYFLQAFEQAAKLPLIQCMGAALLRLMIERRRQLREEVLC